MKCLYALLFMSNVTIAMAQSGNVKNTSDTTKTSYLDEVVVSANKIPEQRRNVAQQVSVVSTETIRNLNAQTSADLIQNTGVVAMQRSQQGGGSPMLRGFEASRVLLVIDGVRMNNLIYRAGHLLLYMVVMRWVVLFIFIRAILHSVRLRWPVGMLFSVMVLPILK
jgi:outer membrane cobalamin receptor